MSCISTPWVGPSRSLHPSSYGSRHFIELRRSEMGLDVLIYVAIKIQMSSRETFTPVIRQMCPVYVCARVCTYVYGWVRRCTGVYVCVRVCVLVVESPTVRYLLPLPSSFENNKISSFYSSVSIREFSLDHLF